MATGKKILIIEDNPLNLELATDILETAGYVVCQAATAEKGIQLARSLQPDLILMDTSLPGMDGLSATRILTQEESTEHIPIISLTAHAMEGDKEKALAAGAKAYLIKPIDTRTFADTITQFLNGEGLSKAA